ncbi:MAG: hypothetical protein ABI670_19680 [Chloroflexota bacterium]
MYDPNIVFGMSASALVVIIVQVAKALNLPMALAPWFALWASVVVVACGILLHFVPTMSIFVEGAVQILFVFLIATGLYEVGKSINKVVQRGR